MKTLRVTLVAVLLVVSLGGVAATPAAASHEDGDDCSFPLTVTDDTGTEVTLNGSAETVVVADPASAQTFWEIGAEDRVVGMPVNQYTEYLEGSEERTHVIPEGGMGVDTETVIELDADLVIGPSYVMSNETVQQLRDANQTVYSSSFEDSFEAIYEKTELFGHFVGECEAGAETAEETRQEVESVREAVADAERPGVLFYFYGVAAGDATFTHDIVESAGGTNVAAEAGVEDYQEISDEVILEADPEWIVTTDEEGSFDADEEPFPSTTAVQNDQVLRVDGNLVQQAGPRVVEPLRAMAEAFHPEAFEAENATETPAETRESTPGGDSEDDGTGFGVAVAAAALLAAALLARRP